MKVHYLFICLLISSLYGCFQDCTPQDVKVGEADLMSESKVIQQKFFGKKIVFRNQQGNEIAFIGTNNLKRDTSNLLMRINCNSGITSNSKSHDFVELAGYKWVLTSNDLEMGFSQRVTFDVSVTVKDSNKIFDLMYLDLHDKAVYCGLGFGRVTSTRGHSDVLKDMKNLEYLNPVVIKDTTVYNKRFQDISFRKRLKTDLCTAGLSPSPNTPLEIYYTYKDGLLAFKTLDDTFWIFDRIE